jgi:formylglycine-generating enzyme required for sulfatase activity
MRCPYCAEQHPEEAQFCPVTGKTLLAQQSKSRGFYTALGLFSGLLVIVSLIMLLASNKRFIQSGENPIANSSINNPTTQSNSLELNLPPNTQQRLPTQKPEATALPTSTPTQTPIPIPSPVELKVNSIDGAEIVLIPAGEFLMGSDQANDPYFWGAEAPQHAVTLDSFWMYRNEVTQSMYRKCDEENACPAPVTINDPVAKQYGNSRFDDYPVVMVTWQAALAYCQWAGGRLPTEAEWEKAARGTDGRLFPWGNDPNADGLANFSSSSPSPVGSYPVGSSPYGVYDMAGNVLEWVNDFFEPLYYEYSPLDNPLGPDSGSRRVIRGGAFNHNGINGIRTVARASLRPTDTKISVGFRCAMDAP